MINNFRNGLQPLEFHEAPAKTRFCSSQSLHHLFHYQSHLGFSFFCSTEDVSEAYLYNSSFHSYIGDDAHGKTGYSHVMRSDHLGHGAHTHGVAPYDAHVFVLCWGFEPWAG